MEPSDVATWFTKRSMLAVLLAGIAGFVDAAGYLTLNLFSAHMSGNSARLGVYLGRGLLLRAAPSAFAVAVFVLSIALGTLVIELAVRSGRRAPASAVLGVEAVLLGLLFALGRLAAVDGRIPPSPADRYYPLAALAVAAMGLQTSTLQRLSGQTVRTTYVSGMLTNLAEEVVNYRLGPAPSPRTKSSYLQGELGLEPGPRSLQRIWLIAIIWLTYVGGAVLGSYLQGQWHLACFLVPVGLLLLAIPIERKSPVEIATQAS